MIYKIARKTGVSMSYVLFGQMSDPNIAAVREYFDRIVEGAIGRAIRDEL